MHFRGRKHYRDLPGYCRGFDVAVMPFKLNELTLSANPLKVREYLAAGLHCVSSDLPEVRRIGLCKIAGSAGEFLAKVDEALADEPGPRKERAMKVFHEGWEARVDDIRRHVSDALFRRAERDQAARNEAVAGRSP
jgi:hypothetical protein